MYSNEIRAEVLPWTQAPPIEMFGHLAILVCNRDTRTRRLWVHPHVEYDHARLAADANALLDAFENGDLDDKWEDAGDGSFARFLPYEP